MLNIKKKVLYLFITHKKNYEFVLNKISGMGVTSIAVVGSNKTYFDDKTLFVDALDNYDGLPEKVYKALSYVTTIKKFNKFTHFCKLDDDMKINKMFTQRILFNLHYGGNVQYSEGMRNWGADKFSKNSKFSNELYEGEFVPWCRGGYGYIISREAINNIKRMNVEFNEEPYEDLLIAKLLNQKKIYPKNIINLHEYVYSKNHQ